MNTHALVQKLQTLTNILMSLDLYHTNDRSAVEILANDAIKELETLKVEINKYTSLCLRPIRDDQGNHFKNAKEAATYYGTSTQNVLESMKCSSRTAVGIKFLFDD